jgi:class 3 adenylate cyclase
MSETRKLAAILVADIVGYSRLAGADEDRILARLRALRSDLIDPSIAVHHGRVVKPTGDDSLIEFRSCRRSERHPSRTHLNASYTPTQRLTSRSAMSA